MAKPVRPVRPPASAVRTRRAYFDCRFGQLHVRTAFPATGGFDEQVPLFCLHPSSMSGRVFGAFLAAIADRRSVYAPDLPGFGESDAPGSAALAAGAASVQDLAVELRLRRIDVLGFADGCGVALDLCAAAPGLVRRLVLVGAGAMDRLASIGAPCLVLGIGGIGADPRVRAADLPAHVEFASVSEYGEDLFEAAPQAVAKRCAAFLDRGTEPS